MMNLYAKATNSNAKPTNSVAHRMNSTTKVTKFTANGTTKIFR